MTRKQKQSRQLELPVLADVKLVVSGAMKPAASASLDRSATSLETANQAGYQSSSTPAASEHDLSVYQRITEGYLRGIKRGG